MTINIAILGPGRIAEKSLAPAVARVDGTRLWSVLSRDRERAAAFAERHAAVCVQFENGSPAHDRAAAGAAGPGLDAK